MVRDGESISSLKTMVKKGGKKRVEKNKMRKNQKESGNLKKYWVGGWR